jgi:hypothetical protein
VVNLLAGAVVLLTVPVTSVSLAVRFRRARGLERQQLRHAAHTIATFSTRLRDQVDLTTLTGELLAVVDQTMQPPGRRHGCDPKRRNGQGTPTAVRGAPDDPAELRFQRTWSSAARTGNAPCRGWFMRGSAGSRDTDDGAEADDPLIGASVEPVSRTRRNGQAVMLPCRGCLRALVTASNGPTRHSLSGPLLVHAQARLRRTPSASIPGDDEDADAPGLAVPSSDCLFLSGVLSGGACDRVGQPFPLADDPPTLRIVTDERLDELHGSSPTMSRIGVPFAALCSNRSMRSAYIAVPSPPVPKYLRYRSRASTAVR